jgi:Leu/Phe-tRNA-protein transferase
MESATEEAPTIFHLFVRDMMDAQVMSVIEDDMVHDYYVSDDWTQKFYIVQAIRGFIAVGYTTAAGVDLLLPQMQHAYCILDFNNIHKGEKLGRSIGRHAEWRLRVNRDIRLLLQMLNRYHQKTWLNESYCSLITEIHQQGPHVVNDPLRKGKVAFHICSVELYDDQDNLVAGELGYVIGSTFTSLTGFCERRKGESIGKIQLVALAKVLESCGFEFLNLGQPPSGDIMRYKKDIGGVVYTRRDFLNRWMPSINRPPPEFAKFSRFDSRLCDLGLC